MGKSGAASGAPAAARYTNPARGRLGLLEAYDGSL